MENTSLRLFFLSEDRDPLTDTARRQQPDMNPSSPEKERTV